MKSLLPILLFVGMLWPAIVVSQTELSDTERQVKYFDMSSGLAAKLENRMVDNYLEIIESQRKKIKKLKKEYLDRGKQVQQSTKLTAEQQLAQLEKLRTEQNKALQKILLPHQVRRLEGFALFLVINQEGFANSMVHGFVAKHLELSVAERRIVRDEAAKALEEYEKAVIRAQKKAIASLRASIPKGKQKKLDDMLEPMLHADGSFWKPWKFMLEVSEARAVHSFPKLPSLKK